MWKMDRVGGLSSTGCITKEQRGQFQAGVDGWTLRRGRDSKEREERNEGGWGDEDGGCDQQVFCIFCLFLVSSPGCCSYANTETGNVLLNAQINQPAIKSLKTIRTVCHLCTHPSLSCNSGNACPVSQGMWTVCATHNQKKKHKQLSPFTCPYLQCGPSFLISLSLKKGNGYSFGGVFEDS